MSIAGIDRKQIAQLVPALVQDDVFDPVLGREIDIVFVGLGVDAGPEVHAGDVQAFHQSQATLPGLTQE